jgi:hypothetical protein
MEESQGDSHQHAQAKRDYRIGEAAQRLPFADFDAADTDVAVRK